MIRLVRTDSTNRDFEALVRELDADLARRDGEDHAFYAQFNKTNKLAHVVLAYAGETPVTCGALRAFDQQHVEVKRMFTIPAARGKGYAARLLAALEEWAAELGYQGCVLETGKNQPEAISMYLKCGYTIIPNYGQYAGIDNSVCFQKKLGLVNR